MSTFVSVSNLFSQSVRSQILAFYLRGGQLRKIGVLKKLNLRPFEFLSACNAFVLLPHKVTGDKLLSISASLVFINPITPSYADWNSNVLYFRLKAKEINEHLNLWKTLKTL